MTQRMFVPRDASALSVGAERVLQAIGKEVKSRGLDVEIVRNGSRGLYWLEPLVEVEIDGQRIAYGPLRPEDVAGLFEAGWLQGHCGSHALCHGPTEEIPYLKRQTRVTFARMGVTDPLSLEDYRAHGGFKGLERALAMKAEEIVAAIDTSGLRGRGGAGFPTGIKWRTVMNAEGAQKYIVCNADEGDSGTFSDRMQMEGDPYGLIEGMIIAGLAVGADTGYIYLRSEYPHAWEVLPGRCWKPPSSRPRAKACWAPMCSARAGVSS